MIATASSLFVFLFLLLQLLPVSAQNCEVTSFSGTGLTTPFVDTNYGGSTFSSPMRVARDTLEGRYYAIVADRGNNVLRGLYANGTTTTFAGSQLLGDVDGTGLLASFNGPYDLTLNGSGTIFVIEGVGARVRMVTPDNVVTTVAGGQSCGIYCINGLPDALYGFGNNDGPGVVAQFGALRGSAISIDGTKLFICDMYNNKIRAMSTSPPYTVTTYAGNGFGSPLSGAWADGAALSASFYYPMGAIMHPSGYVYVADAFNNRIRAISPDGGLVTTIGGNGAAGFRNGPVAISVFNAPWGVGVDWDGNLLIADTVNQRIRKLDLSVNEVITIAGSGTTGFANGNGTATTMFSAPRGIATMADGSYLVADHNNNRIRRIVCPSPSSSPSPSQTSSPGASLSSSPPPSPTRTPTMTPTRTASPTSGGWGH